MIFFQHPYIFTIQQSLPADLKTTKLPTVPISHTLPPNSLY